MSSFPAEIWCMVASLLRPADRIALASTSTTLASIVYETESLWTTYDLSRELQKHAPGITTSCAISDDGQKLGEPASTVTGLLTLLLDLKISPPAKANIRNVLLDNRNITESDFRATFKSFPSLDLLSFQNCNATTIAAFARFLDSLATAPLTLPNPRRISLRGCQNPEDVLWSDVRRIRDTLQRTFSTDLVIDLDLVPCHLCNHCAEPEADPCRACHTTTNTWCRRCQRSRACVGCDSRMCEFCIGTGKRHRFAACDKHRICAGCTPVHQCAVCKVPCCPADGCRRSSVRCKGCDVALCRGCVGRAKFCGECGLCGKCTVWKRTACDRCGMRCCGSRCMKGHTDGCAGRKIDAVKRTAAPEMWKCMNEGMKITKKDGVVPLMPITAITANIFPKRKM